MEVVQREGGGSLLETECGGEAFSCLAVVALAKEHVA